MVTLEKKLEIIDELAKGKSQRYISNLYDVPKSTIDDIWRDKEKIEHPVSLTDEQAYDALSVVITWLESQGNIDPIHILLVKKWKAIAGTNCY